MRQFVGYGPNFSAFFTFAVGELHMTVDLIVQDAILGDQIVIAPSQSVAQRV
jgi:hypothetical protein